MKRLLFFISRDMNTGFYKNDFGPPSSHSSWVKKVRKWLFRKNMTYNFQIVQKLWVVGTWGYNFWAQRGILHNRKLTKFFPQNFFPLMELRIISVLWRAMLLYPSLTIAWAKTMQSMTLLIFISRVMTTGYYKNDFGLPSVSSSWVKKNHFSTKVTSQ